MKNFLFFTLFCFICSVTSAQTLEKDTYTKSLADYTDFKKLVGVVENHRESRLIDLDTFLAMSLEKNTIILDARSDFRFKRKHIKGALNLSFSDFTQKNLHKLVPNSETKILIYCNNNFTGDQVDFETKAFNPLQFTETQILSNRKPILLALNIPTYINLYGYGYRNIYELNELVEITDKRITFEGSAVK